LEEVSLLIAPETQLMMIRSSPLVDNPNVELLTEQYLLLSIIQRTFLYLSLICSLNKVLFYLWMCIWIINGLFVWKENKRNV